jgi:hypothetical protein
MKRTGILQRIVTECLLTLKAFLLQVFNMAAAGYAVDILQLWNKKVLKHIAVRVTHNGSLG